MLVFSVKIAEIEFRRIFMKICALWTTFWNKITECLKIKLQKCKAPCQIDEFWLNAERSGERLPEAFFLVFGLESQGTKACKYCRSRQELSNEYLLAKFGFDTAENEPLRD